ncbi:MAG: NADH-quinone oxidoreductase subunit M [Candidatus Pelagibacter sp. TMED64]|nr:NADH-quinone oxidoreductase subunit M [Candidatus Pelagibacter sp.]OUU67552.1 MAG: NADH-quinone oxidoreductase subunit M [Candidatus Pelagibacter sp. TMED64]|tara:strand:+ start:905 stop:2431 length:1527 start_codon:yes stop_codon:yes gene_type:complete
MELPILSFLILLPILGSFFILITKGNSENIHRNCKNVALFTSLITFLLTLFLWFKFDFNTSDFQFIEEKNWINGFVNFKIGIDGISLVFLLLTTFITPICIISGSSSIKFRIKEFLISFLIMETLIIGVFCSLDLIIFYLFFEAGLIPMFLIIGIWGGERRVYSAFKFFLYTLLGSVLMLIAIISIFWITNTTDIIKLYEIKIFKDYQYLLWLAFFCSFAVKLPMWPFHTWLPDAHVEAPTAGSVILAAILLKMAGYGFIRFSIGMFPVASEFFTPFIYTLSIIAIIYTSLVALMQEDMKKLIAYSSVAHMGFVTIGIFSLTKQGLEGSIFQMFSHGLISAALFLCVGVVYDRYSSRKISSYGGLVNIMPKYALFFMIFTLASLGLPGTSGFVGEILVLFGVFQVNYVVAVLASTGVVLAAAYMLWLYKRVVFGDLNESLKNLADLNKQEIFVFVSLASLIIFFGFYPDPLLKTISPTIDNIIYNYEQNLIYHLNDSAFWKSTTEGNN